MKALHRVPYRCRSCKARFFVYVAPERDEVEETAEVEALAPEAVESKAETAHNPDVR
jgi:hypothetical protein